MNVFVNCLLHITLCLVSCIVTAQQELPPTESSAPDSVKLKLLWKMGDSLVDANQFIPAKKIFEQALAISQAGDDTRRIGISYRKLGSWSESTGDYGQAIDWFLKSQNTFKIAGDQRNFARSFRFIGFCYNRLNKVKEARQYIERGIAYAQQFGYDQLLPEFYSELINIDSHGKQYASASAYTEKVLAYYKQKKDWQTYYGTLFNAGLLYKNMGQYVRSEQAFRQAMTYAVNEKDEFFQGYINTSIPYALIPQNKLDEAEVACQRALNWVEKTGVDKYAVLEDVNSHLSRIYEIRGDFRQALTFYKRQMANHDSVFNATKNRQVAELETRYQMREKEENIQQLASTNARQTRQIWAGIGGLIVLTILLGTLYWLYERVRQSHQKIAQQSDQLTIMMKELHHRVKNNLAIVSSLLKLQSSRLDDEKAIQAVRVGQQRVEAMSLIHQRLYQTDEVTTVNMRDYLTDLSESLMRAYDYPADEFDLQLNIELQELDVDMAMPLGLIVNELVTNAFKYAYDKTNGKRPLLRIDLRSQSDKSQPGITLEVQDNGPGIDVSDWQQKGNKSSFGKRLIASLSEQLEGHFELLKQNGTLFRLHMPNVRASV
ncbi:tetratricopeptide repeat protein [Spirosoma sp. HMF4905]|uniref:histidine kinase n=1 Tax=Spirosoma arboris TaxID=2682092 RepID=A0A7K1SNK1_9BACT|nr:histidine kinase dimerization/phosphoacceptor domain -containing protein [Spirosoma arboris]MVM35382.1 tetratricopeptide repeat protein [Spirosoma arboris]